ncbi:hypothetical protein L195_g060231, partial [Trifolium pratense]
MNYKSFKKESGLSEGSGVGRQRGGELFPWLQSSVCLMKTEGEDKKELATGERYVTLTHASIR